MSKLDGIVKDIFSKSLSAAKSKINNTLSIKLNDVLDSMKKDVASNLFKTEESDEGDLSEVAPLKKRIDPKERRERAKDYRKNKIKVRQKQKKYRNSSKGRKTKMMQRKMDKLNKTSTGKRKSTITNKVQR